jgi:hypothetical protein
MALLYGGLITAQNVLMRETKLKVHYIRQCRRVEDARYSSDSKYAMKRVCCDTEYFVQGSY